MLQFCYNQGWVESIAIISKVKPVEFVQSL